MISNLTGPVDDNGHGTFMMGTAVGNQITLEFGLASLANIYPIKVADANGISTTTLLLKGLAAAYDHCTSVRQSSSLRACIVYLPFSPIDANRALIDPVINNLVNAEPFMFIVTSAGNSRILASTVSPGSAAGSFVVASSACL